MGAMLKSLAAKIIAGAVAIAVIVGLVILSLQLWQSMRGAKAQDRVDKAQTNAAQATGGEAVNTVGNVSEAAQADRKTSQEAQDAINRAEAGNSNDAADAAVCSLRAYRDTERCRQLRAIHP
jgi:hypothetical protein